MHLEPLSALHDDELFEAAFSAMDESARWYFVDELRQRGSRSIAERAVSLVHSADRRQRLVGVDVLNDFGAAKGFPFRQEYTSTLIGALTTTDTEELENIIAALGKTGDERALPHLLGLASHPSALVRLRLAQALPGFADEEAVTENDPLVLCLLALMNDEDPDVRDWATFGVGTALHVDGPNVRDALRACLDRGDDTDNSRSEALAGLVARHEPGIHLAVLDALTGEHVSRLAVESAGLLGDPRLHSALTTLRSWWDVDRRRLEESIQRCDPDRVANEIAVMEAMVREAAGLDPNCRLVFTSTRFDRETSVWIEWNDRTLGNWSLAHVLNACDHDVSRAVRAILGTN